MLEKEFESHSKRASQFKKSQTAVRTEGHFTLSVVCLIVECTKDSVRVSKKKNIKIVVQTFRMDRKVCPTTTTSKTKSRTIIIITLWQAPLPGKQDSGNYIL